MLATRTSVGTSQIGRQRGDKLDEQGRGRMIMDGEDGEGRDRRVAREARGDKSVSPQLDLVDPKSIF